MPKPRIKQNGLERIAEDFIENAERAFFDVMESANRQTLILPTRFNTLEKIYQYFRRYWSPTIARRMVCNMPVERSGGNLILTNDPDLDITTFDVVSLQILVNQANYKVVRAVLNSFSEEFRQNVTYEVRRESSTGRFIITNRSGAEETSRYRSCEL